MYPLYQSVLLHYLEELTLLLFEILNFLAQLS